MTKTVTPLSDFAVKRLTRIERANRGRARNMGCDAIAVDFIAALDQQGWLCSICSDAMDPELTPENTQAISLEHNPALSCGGSHTPGHVFGAHLACNLAKGRTEDTTRAAKVKRQAGLTGQQKRRAEGKTAKIQSAGFQTNRGGPFKATIGGKVTRRAGR